MKVLYCFHATNFFLYVSWELSDGSKFNLFLTSDLYLKSIFIYFLRPFRWHKSVRLRNLTLGQILINLKYVLDLCINYKCHHSIPHHHSIPRTQHSMHCFRKWLEGVSNLCSTWEKPSFVNKHFAIDSFMWASLTIPLADANARW